MNLKDTGGWQVGVDHVCVRAIGTCLLPDERVLSLLAPRG